MYVCVAAAATVIEAPITKSDSAEAISTSAGRPGRG
jgi:hypothetical protein